MGGFETESVTVDSWAQAQEELFAGSWQEGLNRYRPTFAYRGLCRRFETLPTSLIRLGRQPGEEGFDTGHGACLERDILRNFVKYAADQTLSERSIWHQLSVAQHHGLPTRILDWTYSPLVALHFATADLDALDEEGMVWVVDIERVHEGLPDSMADLKGGLVYTVDELQEIAEDLDEFDAQFSEGQRRPVFFEPPSLDDRIVNQFALFSIYPDPEVAFDEWLDDHPDAFKKVFVPPRVKMEIRDKLDASNVTERVLFPGLDGLADWLKRYYSPIGSEETLDPETR